MGCRGISSLRSEIPKPGRYVKEKMLIEDKDCSLDIFFRDRETELDKEVYEKVSNESELLLMKSEDYILSIFKRDNPLLKNGLNPSWITIEQANNDSYHIKTYFTADCDNYMQWRVTFILVICKGDKSLKETGFVPIEFSRYVS